LRTSTVTGGGYAVADDGTVVFADGSSGLKLLHGGENTGGTDDRLYALNTASGAFTLLFKDGFGPDNIHSNSDLF